MTEKEEASLHDYKKDKVQAVRFNSKLLQELSKRNASVQKIFDLGMRLYIKKLKIDLTELGLEPSVKGRKPNKPKAKKEKSV